MGPCGCEVRKTAELEHNAMDLGLGARLASYHLILRLYGLCRVGLRGERSLAELQAIGCVRKGWDRNL